MVVVWSDIKDAGPWDTWRSSDFATAPPQATPQEPPLPPWRRGGGTPAPPPKTASAASAGGSVAPEETASAAAAGGSVATPASAPEASAASVTLLALDGDGRVAPDGGEAPDASAATNDHPDVSMSQLNILLDGLVRLSQGEAPDAAAAPNDHPDASMSQLNTFLDSLSAELIKRLGAAHGLPPPPATLAVATACRSPPFDHDTEPPTPLLGCPLASAPASLAPLAPASALAPESPPPHMTQVPSASASAPFMTQVPSALAPESPPPHIFRTQVPCYWGLGQDLEMMVRVGCLALEIFTKRPLKDH